MVTDTIDGLVQPSVQMAIKKTVDGLVQPSAQMVIKKTVDGHVHLIIIYAH